MSRKRSDFAFLIILAVVFLLPMNWWRIELMLNPISVHKLQAQDVILYSTSWCGYCKKTRNFLNAAGIAFTERDIEKSARAFQQYQLIHGKGVPVLQIGPGVIHGYDTQAIRQAVDSLAQARQSTSSPAL